MPACSFMRSKRLQQVRNRCRGCRARASHWPLGLARYSYSGPTAPLRASTSFMTSSTGSREFAYWFGSQAEKSMMSWPDLASASAAIVR